MNNTENETIFRDFFRYLHADVDNQNELSDFIKDNHNVLTSHLPLMYSVETSNMSWSINLMTYFYSDNSKDDFKQKMIFL